MFPLIGLAVVLVCVFGSFAIAGGNITIILGALPTEMVIIVGAAVGAFIISNKLPILKGTIKSIKRASKGSKWTEKDYRDLLGVMYALVYKYNNVGPQGIEEDIENPANSEIFKSAPKIVQDPYILSFIRDYLRVQTMDSGKIQPYQIVEMMDADLDRYMAEEMEPQHALERMADGLPAIGIIAAVLGVIKTMASINEPTEVLGAMIGGALVGTFLGVLLSYCVVGPIAARLKQVIEDDAMAVNIVRTILYCGFNQYPPHVAVEMGRRMVPHDLAPSFDALDEQVKQLNDNLKKQRQDN